MNFDLDRRPIFEILHSLLRPENEMEYDAEATAKVWEWVFNNSSVLKRVTDPNEYRLFLSFYDHWEKHHIAPTRKMLWDLVHAQQKCEPVLQILEEYDNHADDLEQRSHLDLDMFLDQRKLDWETQMVVSVLDKAAMIATSSVPDVLLNSKSKEKVTLTGPRDALKFFNARMGEGLLLDHVRRVGGDTATEGVEAVKERIDQTLLGQTSRFLTQTPIDEALRIGPGATIRYVGLLGFSGQRKSTLATTLTYLAATQGYKVLYVPRECSVEDQWMRFFWLHAGAIGRSHELPPLAHGLDDKYVRREHKLVIDAIAADMRVRGIRIEVESLSTFAEVKQAAEAHINDPYDVLCVDYIAHLNTPGHRDHREGIQEAFRAAQMLSQNYEDRRGLVVMTPLQAGKKHADAVGQPDAPLEKGIYAADIGQIDWFTDAGRDIDAIIGVWSGDGFREHDLARISCVKTRQQWFQPFFMSIDQATQRMSCLSDSEAMQRIGGPWSSSTRYEPAPGPLSDELTELDRFYSDALEGF